MIIGINFFMYAASVCASLLMPFEDLESDGKEKNADG